MNLETQLRDELHHTADALPDDPGDLAAVVRSGRRRRVAVPAAAGVIAVLALVLATTFGARLGGGETETAWDGSTSPTDQVALFLCDGSACPRMTGTQMVTLLQAIQDDDEVASVVYEDSDGAYARFLEQFAGNDDLIASIAPEDLPESFRLNLEDGVAPADVASRYASYPGVEVAASP